MNDNEYLGEVEDLNELLSDEESELSEEANEEDDSIDEVEELAKEEEPIEETEEERNRRLKREKRREYRKKKAEEKKKLLEIRKNMTPREIEEENRRTLFVSNVPLETKAEEFKKYFSQYGNVLSVRFRNVPLLHPGKKSTRKSGIIRKDFHPDRSSMSAYIIFESKSSADAALKENGEVYNGKHLFVDLASNKPGKKKDDNVNAVFVSNLPFGAEEEELYQMFEKCGRIINIRIVRDEFYKACKGFAYIKFETEKGYENALKLHQKIMYKEKKVHVSKVTERKPSKISRTKEMKNKIKTDKPKKMDPKQLQQKYKNKRRKILKKK